TMLTAIGEQDLGLVKFDGSGNFLWAKTWGTSYNDWGHDMYADENGNVYLTGEFSVYTGGNPIFDTIHFDAYALPVDDNGDIFVVKADTDGNIIWAKRAGSSQIDHSWDISADALGNVYVSGVSGSTMHFETINLPNADVFVAKYDSNGNVLWAKSGGTTQLGTFFVSHAVDNNGNVYLAGMYYQATSFTFGSTTINWDDGFIVKYNSAGTQQWAKNMGTAMYSTGRGYSIATDNNAIYVGGIMEYSATFLDDTLTSNGFNDVLVVKYDLNGNYIWATHAGGSINDGAYDLALDNNGSLLVTGYIASNNAEFSPYTLASEGYWDMFVGKLSAATGLPVTQAENGTSIYPSPANEQLIISTDSKELMLEVYDMAGRVLICKEMRASNGKCTLDVSGLPDGMYILSINENATINRQKFAVQH
ncbi:MAG TPA: T9SS type A sorting domain-containing protein, partial [Flavipsychrobacter sp.]|nr:T9SS type A sorting domain-containing protein [Flavipsychrobacter sp.]